MLSSQNLIAQFVFEEVEKDFFDMISSGEDTAAATAPAPAT